MAQVKPDRGHEAGAVPELRAQPPVNSAIPDTAACSDHSDPWVTLQVLGDIRYRGGYPLIRCPESEHCLLGAVLIDGRIAVHDRNVAGTCPWVGLRVAETLPACGCETFITTRQLRIVLRRNGHPAAPIHSINCPGNCRAFAPVDDGRIGPHGSFRCPWTGIQVVDRGMHPPLLTPEPPP